MKLLLLFAVLVAFISSSANAAVSSGSARSEVIRYDLRIRILRAQIIAQCPSGTIPLSQGQPVTSGSYENQLEERKKAYSTLWNLFLSCHSKNIEHSLSPTPPTTPTTTTPTTTTPAKPQPAECQTAANFTESWRLDHSGSEIKPGGPHSRKGFACDVHNDTAWFRFVGAAGNKMLDSCPKRLSCGAEYSYYTEDKMPQEVGVTQFVKTSYALENGKCRESVWPMQVMRCSNNTPYDLIYKMYYRNQAANHTCSIAFCGMMS